MIRYLGQKDQYKCAPIVIINLLKWAGEHATIKDLDQFCELMNTEPGEGTSDSITNSVLQLIPGIKVNQYKYIKDTKTIKNALNRNKAVIVSYYYPSFDGGHIFLCIGHKNNKYKVVNYYQPTVRYISSMEMSLLLKRKGTKSWIITKE